MAGITDSDLANGTVRTTLNAIQTPHQNMHIQASEILNLAKTDKDAAYSRFVTEIKPLTVQVIS